MHLLLLSSILDDPEPLVTPFTSSHNEFPHLGRRILIAFDFVESILCSIGDKLRGIITTS